MHTFIHKYALVHDAIISTHPSVIVAIIYRLNVWLSQNCRSAFPSIFTLSRWLWFRKTKS